MNNPITILLTVFWLNHGLVDSRAVLVSDYEFCRQNKDAITESIKRDVQRTFPKNVVLGEKSICLEVEDNN